jgi:hypothetical protein
MQLDTEVHKGFESIAFLVNLWFGFLCMEDLGEV